MLRNNMADFFLVVDLEATCWDAKDTSMEASMESETIEIGAVMCNSLFAPVAEFNGFIKPINNPLLSQFCTDLTGITQSQVDAAQPFPPVISEFSHWFSRFEGSIVFCSWGNYDRNQIQRDCELHSVSNPMPASHINLKAYFAKQQGTKKMGMKWALGHVGLPLEGQHHSGIDDARNIAKLLPYCFDTSAE